MSGTGDTLRGRRILVAEDEYMIADEVTEALQGAGAEVVGPVGHVGEALDLALREEGLDGAVLDMSLNGEMIWPVLDALAERGVSVVLATGYDASAIPSAYAHLPRCEKPAEMRVVLRTLLGVIQSG